jgi:DNA-binding transcriptional ArsR family regulator
MTMDITLQAGLDALGDATRMAIFQKLSAGPLAVNELAMRMPVSRPAVSQHLRVLKDAGLVSDSKAGTRRYYKLNPEGVARLRAHFEQVWQQAMSNFQVAAEKAPAVKQSMAKPATQKSAAPRAAPSRTSTQKSSIGEKHGKHSGGSRRS